jgi:exopolysaccharide production protein ExoQ
MGTLVATSILVLGVVGFFILERDRRNKPSWAVLLPLVWLLIASSRNVGEWLQVGAPSNSDAYIDGSPVDRNILSIFIAAGLVILYQRRTKVQAILRANIPLLAYFSYCLLSLAWSDFPFVGFKRWIRYLGDFEMVLVLLTERDWFLARRKVYAWAGFLLLPISVLFIYYYPDLGRAYGADDGQMYWTGVTENKNELGAICMIFGLASLARLLDLWKEKGTRKIGQILVHVSVVVLATWLLHVANSATSLACFIFGVTLLVLTSWRPFIRNRILIHLLVGGILGIGVSSLFLGMGTGLVKNLGRNSTLTGRTELWSHALQLVENPVFGTGYESFWVGERRDKMRPFAGGVNEAHNAYLEVYLNLGWVGVMLLALVIVTGYQKIIEAFRRNPNAARLGIAYFVVSLSYGFTEAGTIKFRAPVWISFLISIMGASIIALRQTRESITAPNWTNHKIGNAAFDTRLPVKRNRGSSKDIASSGLRL